MGDLHSLLNMVLFNNQLTKLSNSMLRNKYTNLRTLIIHTNRLVSVAGFEELRSLVRLDVSSNNFKNYELPQKFTFMRKLKYLHVRENGLKRLPNDMNSMVYLQFIDARYNELSKLPTNIDKLKTLKSLYLAGNKICSDMTEEQIISTYKLSMNTNTLNLCAKQCATSCLDKYLNDEVCDDPSVVSLYRVVDPAFKNTFSKNYFKLRVTNGTENIRYQYNVASDRGCNVASCQYDKGDCA